MSQEEASSRYIPSSVLSSMDFLRHEHVHTAHAEMYQEVKQVYLSSVSTVSWLVVKSLQVLSMLPALVLFSLSLLMPQDCFRFCLQDNCKKKKKRKKSTPTEIETIKLYLNPVKHLKGTHLK